MTKDQDFVSPLDGSRMLDPLAREFRQRYDARVVVYSDLREFFVANEIEIDLSSTPDIREEVLDLVASGSYRATHAAVAALSASGGPFTTAEVKAMVDATEANSQISDILGDDDVNEFYWNLLQRYKHVLDKPAYESVIADLRDPTTVDAW